jgi:hypothetical protein
MATEKTTTTTKSVFSKSERKSLALEAAWEIDCLCRLLRKSKDGNWGIEGLADRGILLRVEILCGAITSALSDEMASGDDVRLDIYGISNDPVFG